MDRSMSKIIFNVMRKHNQEVVCEPAKDNGKIMKVAAFKAFRSQFEVVSGKLTPLSPIIDCIMIGHPLIITTNGDTAHRNRQLFARHFDFYEVK